MVASLKAISHLVSTTVSLLRPCAVMRGRGEEERGRRGGAHQAVAPGAVTAHTAHTTAMHSSSGRRRRRAPHLQQKQQPCCPTCMHCSRSRARRAASCPTCTVVPPMSTVTSSSSLQGVGQHLKRRASSRHRTAAPAHTDPLPFLPHSLLHAARTRSPPCSVRPAAPVRPTPTPAPPSMGARRCAATRKHPRRAPALQPGRPGGWGVQGAGHAISI